MADWKKFKVLEFASLVGGGTPDTKNSRYWEGDISWICPSDLTGYTNVYISKGANSITSAGLQNSSAKMLPKETVLVSSRAPVGYVAIAANPLCTNQGFRSLIIKEKVADPKFIYYSLKVYRSVLEAFASGATFPELSGSSFKKIEIPLPLLPEQQRIASILSAYDDLIENNNKRIALLEQTAEQIYKEWFVRMRFPGYENAEFEKGLPKWEITPLSAILKLISGYAFKGDDFLDTPTKNVVVRMGNFNVSRGLRFDTNAKYFPDGYHVKSQHKLSAGDLLMVLSDVTRDGSIIGNVGIVPNDDCNYILNQRVSKIVCDEKLKLFLYCHLSSVSFKNYCLSRADSATVLNLSNRHIYEYKLLLPPEDLIKQFQNIVEPILTEIELLHLMKDKLKQTRDLLMPRLISGKLGVKEIKEAQLSKAAV